MPATGEVTWNGVPVVDRAAFFAPPRSAYTAQVPRLVSDTLRCNILQGLSESDVDLQAAIAIVGLGKDIETLEDGLDTVVGPRGIKLSGGQIQRSAAARMLVRQPELVIFDDLSSALDINTENQLWANLFAPPRSKQPAYLAVSHRRAVWQQADQILVLANGQVVGQGRLTELLNHCEEMQQLAVTTV